jgi:uncharacterized protein YjbI with pentapeptide repeats
MTSDNEQMIEHTDYDWLETLHKLIAEADVGRMPTNRSGAIKARLDAHELWLTSGGAQGARFMAKNEDFTGVDFSRRNLGGAEFMSCIFDYCNFRSTQLLKQTTFFECRFVSALMTTMTFHNSLLSKCVIESCTFTGSKFEMTSIGGTYSTGDLVKPTNNTFVNCNFSDTTFQQFNFLGADMLGARHSASRFFECILANIDMSVTTITTSLVFDDCRLSYAKFSGQVLSGSRFIANDLTQANFQGVIATECDFSNSTLSRATFSNSDFSRSVFSRVNAEQAKFYQATLTDCEARLSNFRKANFGKAKLNKADLSGSDLLGAYWDETTNRNLTNFSGCIWPDGTRCNAGSIGACLPV